MRKNRVPTGRSAGLHPPQAGHASKRQQHLAAAVHHLCPRPPAHGTRLPRPAQRPRGQRNHRPANTLQMLDTHAAQALDCKGKLPSRQAAKQPKPTPPGSFVSAPSAHFTRPRYSVAPRCSPVANVVDPLLLPPLRPPGAPLPLGPSAPVALPKARLRRSPWPFPTQKLGNSMRQMSRLW